MTGKTISTSISSTVTIGTNGYVSPLTITSKGTILPAAYGDAGIYVPNLASVSTIGNSGLVEGSGYYSQHNKGAAGTAIVLDGAAILTNAGIILGGHAGYDRNHAGNGGLGVYSDMPVTIINTGSILGGHGGTSSTYAGAGGAGVSLSNGGNLSNTQVIIAGDGGDSYVKNGAFGGVGVITGTEAIVSNTGTITGGKGGIGGTTAPNTSIAIGGSGGDGMQLGINTVLTNGGTIRGGTGGGHYYVSEFGGYGGVGVRDNSGTIINTGLIAGGDSGQGNFQGGRATEGVYLINYGSLNNQGQVLGGAGKRGGPAGNGVVQVTDGTVTNSGQITGGAGGNQINAYRRGGYGGDGVFLLTGKISNTGTITGGAGGYGGNVPSNGTFKHVIGGGSGGDGLLIGGQVFLGITIEANYKLIQGGIGGALTGTAGYAGNGGTGVLVGEAGSFNNHGTIIGGNGGYAGTLAGTLGIGGVGGEGVYIGSGAHVTNTGTITGGTGGATASIGAHGGAGVYLKNGGVFTNNGTVAGGPGGAGKTLGAQGYAVLFGGTIGSTLVAGPGAVFLGSLNTEGLPGSTLELTGSSAVPFVESFSSALYGFGTVSFAAGAVRTIDITGGGGVISGFAPHDSIVLPEAAIIDATTFQNSAIDLRMAVGQPTAVLDIPHTLTKDFVITSDGNQTTVAAAGASAITVLGNNAAEFVLAGGTATKTTVKTGALEDVYKGGIAAGATLAGGELILELGAKLTAGVSFTAVKSGDLVLDSATMPTATITGFIAGDTIALPGIAYTNGDSVTVANAGVVSINTPGKTYNLNIAGATVGETDFQFSSGSLLTKITAAKPAMAFLRPHETPTGTAYSIHRETDVSTMLAPATHTSAATLAAHAPLLGAADSLRTTLDRNQHITIPQHPA
jgi:hypothetical protein